MGHFGEQKWQVYEKKHFAHHAVFGFSHLSLGQILWKEGGEGTEPQSLGSHEESDVELAMLITSVLCQEATTQEKLIYQELINQINEDLRPHLLELSLKILIIQDLDFDPLTSEERKFWNSFSQWERSMLLTGNPIGIPGLSTQLCCMPGPTPVAPPAPGVVPVQPPLAPGAPAPPALTPQVAAAPLTARGSQTRRANLRPRSGRFIPRDQCLSDCYPMALA